MKTKLLFILPLLAVMISACDSVYQNQEATLAGMSGGDVTVEQLLSDSMLMYAVPGIKITSFRMSAYVKDKDPVEVESNNANLTSSMRETIAQATPGSKIYFEYIKGKDSKGDSLTFKPMAFAIK